MFSKISCGGIRKRNRDERDEITQMRRKSWNSYRCKVADYEGRELEIGTLCENNADLDV